MGTFGPAYQAVDGPRLRFQHDRIRNFMVGNGQWWTLQELSDALGFPEASISAQLRHLRKPEFGSFVVRKRRRTKGQWEYTVEDPNIRFEGSTGQGRFL